MALHINPPHYGYDYDPSLIYIACPVVCKIDVDPGDDVFSLGYYFDSDSTTPMTIPPAYEFGLPVPSTLTHPAWHTLTIVAFNKSNDLYSSAFNFYVAGLAGRPTALRPTDINYFNALRAAEAAYHKEEQAALKGIVNSHTKPTYNTTESWSRTPLGSQYFDLTLTVTVQGVLANAIPNVGVLSHYRSKETNPPNQFALMRHASSFSWYDDLTAGDNPRTFHFLHRSEKGGNLHYQVIQWYGLPAKAPVAKFDDMSTILATKRWVPIPNP
jgi:hypothetical protein